MTKRAGGRARGGYAISFDNGVAPYILCILCAVYIDSSVPAERKIGDDNRYGVVVAPVGTSSYDELQL